MHLFFMSAHACNPNTQDIGAVVSGVQGQTKLYSELESSIDYRRSWVF